MIPIDLVFALAPALLWACLWLAERVRRWSRAPCARWWPRCACVPRSAASIAGASSSSSPTW